MINVLIADNSPIVRQGLKHIAEETPDIAITAEASNRDELLEKARADGCNIAVIDLRWTAFLEGIAAGTPRTPCARPQ